MGSPRPSSQSLAFPKWKPQKTPKSMRSRQGPEEKVTEGHSGDSSDATLEGDRGEDFLTDELEVDG